MADQIEKNNAFFVGNPAWHKKGTLFPHGTKLNTEQAQSIGYPWALTECPAFAGILKSDGSYVYDLVGDKKHIYRSDGTCLGTVGIDYKLQQPITSYQAFQKYLDTGLVELEAGGSLFEGRRLWILGKIKQAELEVLPGDPVKAYMLFLDSFDGSCRQYTKAVNTRVVCANTAEQALGETSRIDIKIKHTKSLDTKSNAATAEVIRYLQSFQHSISAYKQIAAKKATAKQLETYIKSVFVPADNKEELSTKMQNKISSVIDLLDTEEVPIARGTMWHGYNAVTKHLTHYQGHSDDSRLNNQWLGSSVATNSHALQLALAN